MAKAEKALERKGKRRDPGARKAAEPPAPSAPVGGPENSDTYAANKATVDTALKRCNAHLKRLEPEVALETVRRLKDYYLKNGIRQRKSGGFKFG